MPIPGGGNLHPSALDLDTDWTSELTRGKEEAFHLGGIQAWAFPFQAVGKVYFQAADPLPPSMTCAVSRPYVDPPRE